MSRGNHALRLPDGAPFAAGERAALDTILGHASGEQRAWLDAIKDHIARSLRIDEEDFEYAPFHQIGGLGRVHDLFGERLPEILEELNRRLAA